MILSDPVEKAPEPSAKTVLEDIRAAQYQVLKFIPKASRISFALGLSSTLSKIISNPSDVDIWRRLLLMPEICLKASSRAWQQKISLAALVNRQIGHFCQNEDLTSLLGAHIVRKFSKKKKGSARPKLISSKLDEGNIRGAVRIASSAKEMEPPNIRSLDVLKIQKLPMILGTFQPQAMTLTPSKCQLYWPEMASTTLHPGQPVAYHYYGPSI